MMKSSVAAALLCLAIRSSAPFVLKRSAQDLSSLEQWGEKFNSPGAKLIYKETQRQRVAGRTVVTYNVFESGLPQDKHYVLWIHNVGSRPRSMASAYLNENGKVVNVLADKQRQVAEDPIDLVLFGGKGEPFEIGLVSADGLLRVFAEIVPFPIEDTVGPCRLSVIEGAPYYESVTFKLTGLQPNEAMLISTQSEDEHIQFERKADDLGAYHSLLLPFVKGKRSGNTRLAITTNTCKVHLEFPWGEGSYQYQ